MSILCFRGAFEHLVEGRCPWCLIVRRLRLVYGGHFACPECALKRYVIDAGSIVQCELPNPLAGSPVEVQIRDE